MRPLYIGLYHLRTIITADSFYRMRPLHNLIFMNIHNLLNENNSKFSKNHQEWCCAGAFDYGSLRAYNPVAVQLLYNGCS